MTSPHRYLTRMAIFLLIVAAVVGALYEPLFQSFMANPAINGVIVFALIIGISYEMWKVWMLNVEVNWIETYRSERPGLSVATPPRLLAPMATMFGERTGRLSLSTMSMRSILDGISARLDESRDFSRYLIGLLIFLGLLGTFWGLLHTVRSVADVISGLQVTGGEATQVFDSLKSGLQAPLSGMGTAFSSSLFGLAGSLTLGFLDLQAGAAQNRFYNELEDWLANITELQSADPGDSVNPQLRFALMDMQRSMSDLSEKVELRLLNDNTGDAVKDLAQGVDKLIRQMRAEQKVVREWADEQAQQQQELATVLRQITDKPTAPAREGS